MSGRLALVGSGEFLPATEEVDRVLIEGRPRTAVFLPTAAGQEGAGRVGYWLDLGSEHYRRLGIEPHPLPVIDRATASREDYAAEIAKAGLVYLSGGDPAYLATTLAGTVVGEAIRAAFESGTPVGGCSAGAIALTEVVPDLRGRREGTLAGLGLVGGLMVLPHFDQLERWVPGVTGMVLGIAPPDFRVVGVEEETAIIGGPESWLVVGRRRAVLLSPDGAHQTFAAGETFSTLSP